MMAGNLAPHPPLRHPSDPKGGACQRWDPRRLGTTWRHKIPASAGMTVMWVAILLIGLTLIASTTPAHAQTALPPAPWADRQLPDAAQERKAKALMETIRCLTCQSQSIADSGASMAGDMRSEIRQRIAAGEQPEHIRAWLIERYGDWVSYAPTAAPILWPLWAAPVVLLLLGLLLVRGRVRRRQGRAR